MIKLVLATGIYPPQIGGPATYAKLLASELPKRGISVRVVNFGDTARWPKGVRHLIYFFRLLFAVFGADLVFTQDIVSAGFPALLVSKLLRKKLLVRVPGDYAWEQSVQRFGVTESIDDFQNRKYGWRVEALRLLERAVVNGADRVMTPSLYFRDLVAGWCTDPDKVIPVYNGIEFGRSDLSKEEARRQLGLPVDALLAVSAGRLVPWKGFDFLVKLLGRLKRQVASWELVIIGEGPERSKLEEVVKQEGLEEAVRLTGAIPREQLYSYLAAADVFVLNTTFESFSFQVVEAMNQGVPVVTTAIGNLAEIITHGEEGFLVEPNNFDQFSRVLDQLVTDQPFRQKIVDKAKIKSQKFSIDATLAKVAQVVFNLSGKKP